MKKISIIITIIFLFFVGVQVLAADNNFTFMVPDSVITQSSFKNVNYDNKVFGMPLWPVALPDTFIIHTKDEDLYNRTTQHNEFGLNRAAENVKDPSLLIFPVQSDTLTPAIVIFPGGAFKKVVVDKEGIDVAQRMNQYGITAIVVKYRTVPQALWGGWSYRAETPQNEAFYSDAKRAMRLVRHIAADYGIDPKKIGAMGFSAGGRLAAHLLVDEAQTKPEAPDEIDNNTAHPDFGCLTYAVITEPILAAVSPATAPSYLINSKDDGAAPAADAEAFHTALAAQSVETDIHIFPSGGHGYGLGVNGGEVTTWPVLFVEWLNKMGITDADTKVETGNAQQLYKNTTFVLHDNYPNPFNPATTIQYDLSQKSVVALSILNSGGQKIRTLVNEEQAPGAHSITWDSLDDRGQQVASGLYFYQLAADNAMESRKLILIR